MVEKWDNNSISLQNATTCLEIKSKGINLTFYNLICNKEKVKVYILNTNFNIETV